MTKKFGMSFSAKRALGISGAKSSLSRKTGIPLTRQGRQRKFGSAAGCLVSAIIILLTFAILTIGLITGCGSGGKATNPIQVADRVKVNMTEDEVEELVDIKYFQDNKSFLQVMIADLQFDGKGSFKYTLSDKWDDPYYGMFFFSVTADIDVALVVFEEKYLKTSGASPNTVAAIGVVPFATAKEIATRNSSPLWHLRD